LNTTTIFGLTMLDFAELEKQLIQEAPLLDGSICTAERLKAKKLADTLDKPSNTRAKRLRPLERVVRGNAYE